LSIASEPAWFYGKHQLRVGRAPLPTRVLKLASDRSRS